MDETDNNKKLTRWDARGNPRQLGGEDLKVRHLSAVKEGCTDETSERHQYALERRGQMRGYTTVHSYQIPSTT